MRKQRLLALFAASLSWLPSCGSGEVRFGPEQKFTERERPTEWNVDRNERLGIRPVGGTGAGGSQAAGFAAETPEGWKALPPDPGTFKDLLYEVDAASETTCYLTGSVGGGIEGNVLRWYGQMGAAPPGGGIGSLPEIELLGLPGRLVEIEGAYRGKPAMLLGIVAGQGQQCSTLKMVGPKEIVRAQRDRFLELSRSIRRGETPRQAPPRAPDRPAGFAAETPPGWRALPADPAMFKDLHYEVAGDPRTVCYLTGSVGGGVLGNLQRWYGQLGVAPPQGIPDSLPAAELLGMAGRLVEIEGAYKGEPAMLLGIVAGEGQQCATLKMIGPRETVLAQRDSFLGLARSIRRGSPAPAGSPAAGKGPIASYRVPEGWKEIPSESSMRLITFRIGEESELSVIMLGGDGGGVRPNLDRWRAQMDLPPLSDEEFRNLPTIEVFGEKVPLLEMRGRFEDGMTGRSFEDAAFLGALSVQPDGAFFLKLTGPHAEAEQHKQEFLEFCASLRRQS
ncbi:MAG: hypothetical protein Fur0037_22820 [Planctomycetota bacterium]